MGVNLVSPRSTPESLGSPGLRVRPSWSSSRPGRRSGSPHRDLFVITYDYRDQNAKVNKTAQIRSNSQQNLFYRVDHDFIRIMKLASYFSELRLNYCEFLKNKPFSRINKWLSKKENTEMTRGSTRACHMAWWCQHDVIMTSPGVSSADVSSGPYWSQRWPSQHWPLTGQPGQWDPQVSGAHRSVSH